MSAYEAHRARCTTCVDESRLCADGARLYGVQIGAIIDPATPWETPRAPKADAYWLHRDSCDGCEGMSSHCMDGVALFHAALGETVFAYPSALSAAMAEMRRVHEEKDRLKASDPALRERAKVVAYLRALARDKRLDANYMAAVRLQYERVAVAVELGHHLTLVEPVREITKP